MLKILLYGYTTGVRSSRAIERRCHDDVAFRFLAANQAPDHRSIARFRRRHLDALAALFVEVLKLCQAAGMVKLGRVALDGSKVRANASRRKAMSYKRMTERESGLQADVDEMMAGAESSDTAEDERFGPDGRGDDLEGEMARRTSRLAKIIRVRPATTPAPQTTRRARRTRRGARPGSTTRRNATSPTLTPAS